jgi:hypothetical protein
MCNPSQEKRKKNEQKSFKKKNLIKNLRTGTWINRVLAPVSVVVLARGWWMVLVLIFPGSGSSCEKNLNQLSGGPQCTSTHQCTEKDGW